MHNHTPHKYVNTQIHTSTGHPLSRHAGYRAIYRSIPGLVFRTFFPVRPSVQNNIFTESPNGIFYFYAWTFYRTVSTESKFGKNGQQRRTSYTCFCKNLGHKWVNIYRQGTFLWEKRTHTLCVQCPCMIFVLIKQSNKHYVFVSSVYRPLRT
jgi:hypothetical protein